MESTEYFKSGSKNHVSMLLGESLIEKSIKHVGGGITGVMSLRR